MPLNKESKPNQTNYDWFAIKLNQTKPEWKSSLNDEDIFFFAC